MKKNTTKEDVIICITFFIPIIAVGYTFIKYL